jgi:hypothetical protein|tara:strand:- start:1164 stop:1490 length:327 start_codon:yes stop_codon:yes gene_type:complete
MNLYDFETILKFGQHKGETVAEILNNNATYMEWAYGEIDDFYITDAVWMALDCHKGLNDVLKSGEINTQDIKDIIAKNKKFHEEKRERYRSNILEEFQRNLDKKIKGN